MEKIIITTSDSVSGIVVGGRWQAVVKLLPEKDAVIITDSNIADIYGDDFPDIPVLKIEPGEKSKQFKIIDSLAKKLLKAGIDRSGFILGIGGGVVCDVTGFLASVYMRGIRAGYVSTSLLSQVDASTGGKTGVNAGSVKNVLGTFRQPEFVICDTTMLRTLPDDEYLSGMSELIKTGIIGDRSIIDLLENNTAAIMRRERELLTSLVSKAIRYKASVVAKDEKEAGLRRVLNFGHTFGHAVELFSGVKHGYAVAAGMKMATLYSYRKDYISRKDCERITDLLKRYNLSGDINIPPEKMEKMIVHDKKRTGTEMNFVFIKGIEKPVVEKIPVRELIGFYKDYLKGIVVI
ncbi:MAG: 3-dehydroquinate synthase [Bacteroidetes bacterium]|nr:3-dehydroquinate synthase [Bacteroidota bacterium]